MRPAILFDLFAPVTKLPGVGPRIADMIEKIAGARIIDLLWHLPTGVIDRRYRPKIAQAEPGRIATLIVRIDAHVAPRSPRQPYKVRCIDDTGFLHLVFFHARPDYLKKQLPEGEIRVISGTVESFAGEAQMTHPDHIGTLADLEAVAGVEPVYRLTAGLTLKTIGKAVRGALDMTPDLPEWIDAAWLERQGWASWHTSLRRVHEPENESDLDPQTPVRRRLA